MRRLLIAVALITVFGRVALTQSSTAPIEPLDSARGKPSQPFDVWLAELIHEANEKGYSETLLQDTLIGIEPPPARLAYCGIVAAYPAALRDSWCGPATPQPWVCR